MKEVFNINVFDKKSSGVGVTNKNMLNKRSPDLASVAKVSDRKWELSEELYKPFIKKFKKTKSKLIFYRQYLGCWSCCYAINK